MPVGCPGIVPAIALRLGYIACKLWCPSIQTPPVLVSDPRDVSGTGDVTYRTVYSGGHSWLGAAGPLGG